MAKERTYLAWLRTAATAMALGLAVASFADSVSWSSAAAGVLLVAIGAARIVYGTRRYRQVTRELLADAYSTDSRGNAAVLASNVLITALAIAMLLVLIGRD